MDRRKARKSIAGGTTWKVYGTTLVLGLLLAAPLVQAQVTRIGAGEDEILRVKNEQAYANLEDRTHTLTHLTCEDIVVIVP